MAKKSRKSLFAYLRALLRARLRASARRACSTQADLDEVLAKWRVRVREETRQALEGPGGTVVVQTKRKGKKELRTLQERAVATDENPAEVVELPSDDEDEGGTR
jgi:hypothetical protein